MGICPVGDDGHVAYNEPYSSLNSSTRVKRLYKTTKLSRMRYFDNDLNKVPNFALTIGVGTILNKVDKVVCLATGLNKAESVKHALDGYPNHQWSVASICQIHKKLWLVADKEACDLMPLGSYQYFKSDNEVIRNKFKGVTRNSP